MQRRVAVFYAHPTHGVSRVNRRLFEVASAVPGIRVFDLYERYPHFFVDVAAEQAILREADALVFQHPFYWYSCPPLMKQWIDDVLELGFAYGPGGDVLRGKIWAQVISAGGAEAAYAPAGYNHFSIPHLLRPFEQTAYLCQMTPIRPLVLHGASQVVESELAEHAAQYRRFLEDLRDGVAVQPFGTLE